MKKFFTRAVRKIKKQKRHIKEHFFGVLSFLLIFALILGGSLGGSNSAYATSYTFFQTDWSGGVTSNSATHLTNSTGWNEFTSGTNVVVSTAGQVTLSETTHSNFSETFTGTTYKDTTNSNAEWSTSGQISLPSESAGVNLNEKLVGISNGNTINSSVKLGDEIYFGATNGKFLKFNLSSGVATDLTAKISSFWSTNNIQVLALDSANNAIYLGGNGGKFARYNTTGYTGGGTYPTADTGYDLTAKISSFWSSNIAYSLALDSANNVIYLGGQSGKFARYNTTSYTGGGTYPTADTGYDLTSQMSGIWGGVDTIISLTLDSTNQIVYQGGSSGKLARYNTTSYTGGGTYPTADTGYNLTAKISSFWSTTTIRTVLVDSTNNIVYVGGDSGKFARYNTTSYTGGGTYPTADTGYNLTAKISSFWVTSAVYSLALDSANNVIYLGGQSGKFARYNTTAYTAGGTYPTADTGYNLTAKISGFWDTAATARTFIFDPTNNIVYIGGDLGTFARYNTTGYTGGGTYPTADTAYDFSGFVSGVQWGTDDIRSMVAGSNNEIYLGSNGGKFAKYNTQTGIATKLTNKISTDWGPYDINTLIFDSVNNVVYLLGSGGHFGRYNTTSYTGGGTYPTADTFYYLYSKISGIFGAQSPKHFVFDAAAKVIYMGGQSGKLARYNLTTYTAGGTYPTADTGYDLTAKISSFWSTSYIYSLAFDSSNKVVYLGGQSGKFALYNTTDYTAGGTYPTADTAYDLTAKISGFWSTNDVNSMLWDSSRNEIFAVGGGGKFALYNTTAYTAGGTYPTADTAYNLTTKISSFWSTTIGWSVFLDSTNNVVYLGGNSGKFSRYNILTDSASNLRSPDTLTWWSTFPIFSLTVGGNGKLYIGGSTAYFAEKPSSQGAGIAQSLTFDTVSYYVTNVVLSKNDTVGTGSISYQLSNDGGSTWETVTPTVGHQFSSTGSDLRFKITVSGNATVQDVSVEYWGVYNSSGSLVSSKFNTTDSTNVLNKLQWTENLPSGTDLKFQVRTSPDGSTWTSWCGPDDGVDDSCNSSTYFTDPAGSETVDDINNDHVDDQWFQYQAFFTSNGVNTPTLSDITVTYVVNAPPGFDTSFNSTGVNVAQNSTPGDLNFGKVAIEYSVRDTDSVTGLVTPTFEYNVGGGWVPITSQYLAEGDLSDQTVNTVATSTYTVHYATWDAITQIPETYSATAQIRVTIDDNEAANATAQATDTFVLDTKLPALASFTTDVSAEQLTFTISDDSAFTYTISNSSSLDPEAVWSSGVSGTPTIISDYNFVESGGYVKVYGWAKDAHGNTTSFNAVVPGVNSALDIKDISNADAGVYREFISWAPYVATTSASFLRYELYRSTNGVDFSVLQNFANQDTNYYMDSSVASTTIYSYKLATVDTNGDRSGYTATVSDIPNGQGGTDVTAPIISAVDAPELQTGWVKVTWTTDEISNSTVEYSVDGSYSSSASSTAYVTNHSVVVQNLTPDTTYNYRVRSQDIFGNEAVDGGHTFVTPGGPTISGVSVSQTFDRSATIVWNTDEISNSYVEYSTNISTLQSGTPTEAYDSASTTSHSVTLTGLAPQTKYFFYVKSVNPSTGYVGIENNGGSYYEFYTTYDAVAPVISNISTPIKTSTAVSVVWQTDELSNSQIQYGTATGVYNEQTVLDSVLSTMHVVTLPELTQSTKYYYVVRSQDAAGNLGVSSEQTVTTPETNVVNITMISSGGGGSSVVVDSVPPKISGVNVSSVGSFDAKIDFSTDEPASSFVEVGESAEYGKIFGSNSFKSKHDFSLFGLRLGTKYHFRAGAIDKAGNIGYFTDQTLQTKFIAETAENLKSIDSAEQFQSQLDELISSVLPSLTPPFIGSVEISNITESGATISWETNSKAYGSVAYGSEKEYGKDSEKPYPTEVSESQGKAKNHSLILSGLQSSTLYHIEARSFVFQGVVGTSGDKTFTTKSAKVVPTVSDITNSSFAVSWITDQPTTSFVEYKNIKTGEIGQSGNEELSRNHIVLLDKLTPGATYSIRAFGLNKNKSLVEGEKSTVILKKDIIPPEITNISMSNAFMPNTQNQLQTIISWKTNEPSSSVIYYAEGLGGGEDLSSTMGVKDEYVIQHAVIVPGFKPGTAYRFRVESIDQAGNLAQTPVRIVVTPSAKQSVVDVIIKNFEDAFGFFGNISE